MNDLGNAVGSNDVKGVSAALRAGEDPNTCIAWDMDDMYGGQCKQVPVLSVAILNGNMNMVDLLLSYKVNIENQGDCPDTPLVLAAKVRKREKYLKRLLQAGADPMVMGKEGLYAIHWAACHGDLTGVKELHSKGCDLNVKSFVDSTPLHWAARGGAMRVAKWLVSQGANPTNKDLHSETPADYAREEGHTNIAEWLSLCSEPTIQSIQDILGSGSPGTQKKVFVFNYEHFKKTVSNSLGEEATRKGAEMDAKNLNKTFKKLGYQVGISHDLTSAETEDILNQIQNDVSLKFLLVMVLTHGRDSNTFWASDGGVLDLTMIQNKFTDTACPHLKGKPKIIFANFCRGQIREMLETDGSIILYDTPHHMVTIYACHVGFMAVRHRQAGTIFISSICKALEKFPQVTLEVFLDKLLEEMKSNSGTTPQIVNSPPSINDFKF
ncbi:unnamed protein product [Meganyctiphanes norvegica]|uniref:Caspase family p20 domain-containing protein n=1 Tax=Meganyctiphanes norvegica TaxID=48144 RepID=A0AAV2S364_MEGNR